MDNMKLLRTLFEFDSKTLTDEQVIIEIFIQFVKMQAKLEAQSDLLSLRVFQKKEDSNGTR